MFRTIFAVAAVVACLTSASAQMAVEQVQKLSAGDGTCVSRFGYPVALDSGTAVIGASEDFDQGEGSGSAYVFTRGEGEWTLQAKLLPHDGAAGDSFGRATAIDGDTAVIGAAFDDDQGPFSGSAYVFTRNDGVWTEQAKLLPDDGAALHMFGFSVALDGDTAVIGARWDDERGDYSGSAYVFTRENGVWTQQAKLLPDNQADQWFGESVAVDGETAVIGAPQDIFGGGATGSAYVFTRENGHWTRQAKLLAGDGAYGDMFGIVTTINGDTAVVGAPYDDGGSVYVFAREVGMWTQQAKLLSEDGAFGDYFGSAIAVDGGSVVVGAHGDDEQGEFGGSAYVFGRQGGAWSQQAKLLADDGMARKLFGAAVAFEGDTALIGAPCSGYQDPAESSASAYVFRLGCRSEVMIDVKPDSRDNPVNPGSQGVIPVAILGQADFDVTSIDVTSLRFGPGGALPDHDLTDPWVYAMHVVDLNLDGHLDLMQHYRTADAGIGCGDESVSLIGKTNDGCEIEATDRVTTVGTCD